MSNRRTDHSISVQPVEKNCADNTGANNLFVTAVFWIKGRLNRLPAKISLTSPVKPSYCGNMFFFRTNLINDDLLGKKLIKRMI